MMYFSIGWLIGKVVFFLGMGIFLIKPLFLKVCNLINLDGSDTAYPDLVDVAFIDKDHNIFEKAGSWLLLFIMNLGILVGVGVIILIAWPLAIVFVMVAGVFKIGKLFNKKD